MRCAQIALVAAGYSNVEITGVFDEETDEATREFQTDLELYVDGIISKVTATELGVWPGLEAFIVRTPAPAPGAVDLLGMPLSPVASAGVTHLNFLKMQGKAPASESSTNGHLSECGQSMMMSRLFARTRIR